MLSRPVSLDMPCRLQKLGVPMQQAFAGKSTMLVISSRQWLSGHVKLTRRSHVGANPIPIPQSTPN